jgi:ADP-heptose:LPS heptosyltransferase
MIKAEPRKRAILTVGGLRGDSLMITCVLKQLKEKDYYIIALCKYDFMLDLLGDHPHIDEIHKCEYHKPEELEKYEPYDLKVGNGVGIFKHYKERAYLPYAHCQHYSVSICKRAGVYPSDELSMGFNQEQIEWGRQYENAILFHTHSNWSCYKNWIPSNWQKLAERLKADYDYPIYQIVSPSETPVEGIPTIIHPNIKFVAAAVKHCKLLIGLDSAFNHISRAVKKKSIILWGPSSPATYGYEQNINLVNGVVWEPQMGNEGPFLKCQPCYNAQDNRWIGFPCHNTIHTEKAFLDSELHSPKQPVAHACMSANTVDSVFYNAKKLLK